MRYHLTLPAHVGRTLVALSLFAVSACSSGGSSGTNPVPNTNGPCSYDAQAGNIQLAYPPNGSQVSAGSVNRLEVVAAGNQLAFSTTFANYMLVAISQFNTNINATTGNLGTASDPNGYHPYPVPNPGDYYYAAGINQGSIQSGQIYNVYLNVQVNNNPCQPTLVGSFQT